jgi:hypothetical protein
MDPFTQALRDWQIFYSTVALASVTLAGLLFVSLSLRQEEKKKKGHKKLIRLARGSFSDFLYVLMLGLVFLVPHRVPFGLAIALFVLGLSRGLGLVLQVRRSLPSKKGPRTMINTIRETALPFLAAIGLLIVGVEILRNDLEAMYGLVIVVAALLTTASWNAWLILVAED